MLTILQVNYTHPTVSSILFVLTEEQFTLQQSQWKK